MSRKIDLEKLTKEQFQASIDKLIQQVDKEVDKSCGKVNQLLAKYGLKCKMQIVLEHLDDSRPT
jgi:hypothetical protein